MPKAIDDTWDDDESVWESHARQAVESALEWADFDDVRGVIEIFDQEYDGRLLKECKNLDELHEVLSSIYTNTWYGYVPIESGEAVFSDDAEGYVSDFLSYHVQVQEFFDSLRVKDPKEELFQSDEAVKRGESRILRLDLIEINDELIRRLASHPELIRKLDPRKFEELVAELLRDKGYKVQLTPRSKDGGRDIIAIKRDDIGSALTLVECKRYAQDNKVGVDIVRGLYGVVSAENATSGLLATTSYFTSGAKAFRDQVPYRLSLADFDILRGMLSQFRCNQ